MPRYSSRKRSAAKRERSRVRAAMPRDKRQLTHWAVRGSDDDYARFRKHVADVQHRAPSYIEPHALGALGGATRRSMLQDLHKEPWGGGWFSDGLAWLIDKVPENPEWDWLKGLGQQALKPFRGDKLDETDQGYARLVNEAYKTDDERDAQFEHWQHRPEFDSNYVTVYDNEDGHRFIAVRGTKLNVKDLAEDVKIGMQGEPDNLIGDDLRNILDNTAPDKTVDLGAHSLGTSLALTAYQNDDTLQDRIHQSYLYNPAFTPFAENVTAKYEKDDRVRYFIDLADAVSVGDMGSIGPKNVVYRNNWNPISAHKLVQWGGDTGLAEHDDARLATDAPIKKAELPVDYNRDGIPDPPRSSAGVVGDDYDLDLGDDFNADSWNVYWDR